MVTDFRYAYLINNIFFAIVWLMLFFLRPDLRRKMTIMSIIVALIGPFSEFFYLRDYWRPEIFNGWMIGVEDVLFGFFIGGIAGVIYEEVFGKKYTKRHLHGHTTWMFASFLFLLVLMVVGNIFLGYNSGYVSILGFLAIGIIPIVQRHDLLKDAFISGFLMGCLMLVFYSVFTYLFDGIIQKWWLLHNLSGIIILEAPLEELLWGFGWGFVAGPAYEFINGLKFKKL
jgi:hypothetical protein